MGRKDLYTSPNKTQAPMLFSSRFRFGRRFVVLLSLLLLLLFGVGAGFSPNVYVYVLLKFLSGFSVSGILVNAFVIGRLNIFICSSGRNSTHSIFKRLIDLSETGTNTNFEKEMARVNAVD